MHDALILIMHLTRRFEPLPARMHMEGSMRMDANPTRACTRTVHTRGTVPYISTSLCCSIFLRILATAHAELMYVAPDCCEQLQTSSAPVSYTVS